MAEIVLSSNKNSSLYMSSVASGANLAPYVYSMEKSGANLFKDRNVKVNLPGAQFGGSTSAQIPSFGILRSASLRVKFKYTTAAGVATPNVARNIYGTILAKAAIKNSSKQIEEIHGNSLIYKVQQHPDRRRFEVAGLSNVILSKSSAQSGAVVSTAATVTELEVFIPLLFSTFEHPTGARDGRTNGLDMRFIEACTLEVTFNADWFVAIGGTSSGTNDTLGVAPVISLCEAYYDYDVIDDKNLMEIQKNNYSLSEAQSLCNGNEIQNVSTITANGTDINATVTLMNTCLTSGMLVMLYKKRNKADANALADKIKAGTSITVPVGGSFAQDALIQIIQRPWKYHQHIDSATATARHGADFIKIDSLEISTSGRTLFKAESNAELQFLSGQKNRGLLNSSADLGHTNEYMSSAHLSDKNIYFIPFSESQHTDSISGGNISLKSLNSIQVSVTAEGAKSGAQYSLEVITYCSQILQVSGSSGRIVKSLDA